MKASLTAGFIAALLASAALRHAGLHGGPLAVYADLATPIYIGATVVFAIALTRAGVATNRVGFAYGLRGAHAMIGALAAIVILTFGVFGAPFLEAAFGATRDLSRFDAAGGSLRELLTLLAISWTFAAFGEEIAFRIVLMRAIASSLGDGAGAAAIALVGQAVMFGLVHAYQGPAGIAQTFVSGLIYGGAVLAARGSVWPAAIAHGLVNTVGLLTIYAEG